MSLFNGTCYKMRVETNHHGQPLDSSCKREIHSPTKSGGLDSYANKFKGKNLNCME